jgi:transcriptional regulator with PAS, ATPase and Fis domain
MGATMQVSINIEGATIEVIEGLIETAKVKNETILNREINDNFDLKAVMAEVAIHYLKRAVEENGGNMNKVRRSLGFTSYQTAVNWVRKYGVR